MPDKRTWFVILWFFFLIQYGSEYCLICCTDYLRWKLLKYYSFSGNNTDSSPKLWKIGSESSKKCLYPLNCLHLFEYVQFCFKKVFEILVLMVCRFVVLAFSLFFFFFGCEVSSGVWASLERTLIKSFWHFFYLYIGKGS